MTNENIQPLLEVEENPYKVKLVEDIIVNTEVDKNVGFKGIITLNNTYGELVKIVVDETQLYSGSNDSTKIINTSILPDKYLGITYSRMNSGVNISTSKLEILANDIEPGDSRSLMFKALDDGWSVEITGISNNN